MVYSRKSNYRRKAAAASAWYDKKYSAKDLAIKALKNTQYLKGLVNSEMYKYDLASSQTISNTGSVVALANIAQGDTDATRTGNSLLARKMFMRMTFTQAAAADDTLYRVIFFIDKQQVGDTSPAVSDVLDTVSTLAPLNSATTGRFKILKNYFFHTSNSSDTVNHKVCYKDLYHHIRYNGTAAADIQKGGIYMLVLSDQSVNVPTIFYNWRLSYHDN